MPAGEGEDAVGRELLAWRSGPHPKLLVLDLDQTLWPFDASKAAFAPPHSADPSGRGVQCRSGVLAAPFADALQIVRALKSLGGAAAAGAASAPAAGCCRMAVASTNPSPDVCVSLLRHLGLLQARPKAGGGGLPDGAVGGGIEEELVQIRSGSKAVHLQCIRAASGVDSTDMLFFDDRPSNIRSAERLGITAFQVNPATGLTSAAFARGLAAWRSSRASRGALAAWVRPAGRPRPVAEDAVMEVVDVDDDEDDGPFPVAPPRPLAAAADKVAAVDLAPFVENDIVIDLCG